MNPKRVLMSDPKHFGVFYSINAHMRRSLQKTGGSNPVNLGKAIQQWKELKKWYEQHRVAVTVLPAVKGLPDLVFTANSGLYYAGKIVLSRFLHPERQAEEPHFRMFFERLGIEPIEISEPFEGHGDAQFFGETLVCTHGFRSTERGVNQAAEAIEKEPIVLRLVDENFYHGDMCFRPIGTYRILYYRKAFDAESIRKIERLGPTIAVSDKDANNFVCNDIPWKRPDHGWWLVGAFPTERTLKFLVADFIHPMPLELSEFKKSGGGAWCLSFFF